MTTTKGHPNMMRYDEKLNDSCDSCHGQFNISVINKYFAEQKRGNSNERIVAFYFYSEKIQNNISICDASSDAYQNQQFVQFRELFHVNIGTRSGYRAYDLTLALVFLVCPLGEHTLVQVKEDRVKRFHLTIKHTFHVTMSTERFLYVTDSTALCSKLARLKVVDVFVVVEHEADSGSTTMNLEWMSAEHNTLENNSIWCARQKVSIADERH